MQAAAGAALAGLSSLEGLFGQEMAHRYAAVCMSAAATWTLSPGALSSAQTVVSPQVAGGFAQSCGRPVAGCRGKSRAGHRPCGGGRTQEQAPEGHASG